MSQVLLNLVFQGIFSLFSSLVPEKKEEEMVENLLADDSLTSNDCFSLSLDQQNRKEGKSVISIFP